MRGHRYTREEKEFFQSYIPGHTYKEIQKAFTERFDWEITTNQVKGYMANHRINNGLTGRFPKGHVPKNKGQKGVYYPGCEKGWFQKGNTPINHRDVGSERISKDGYVEIKISEPDKWRLKHHIVWESVYGKVPDGNVLIFLNGDKTDNRIENLEMIKCRTHVKMNKEKLRFQNEQITRAGIILAELMIETGKAKKRGCERVKG